MKKLTLTQELKQLDCACDELKTKDYLRNAELRNIQSIIHLILEEVMAHRGDVSSILIEKSKIEDRLDDLARNPNFAGKHEHHRINN